MENQRQNSVYVKMMVDSLRRKESVLAILYQQTKEQEMILLEPELDEARFNQLLEEKGKRIDELTELDQGFDVLFKKVEQEIRAYRDDYAEEIKDMQERISRIANWGVEIQSLEKRNSDHLKVYLAKQRKIIRDFHINNKTAANYYKNMANTHRPEQSYFFNEKK